MCFVLYIATDLPVTSIAWDEHDRKLNTKDLTDHDAAVADHFHKPYRKYVGSDQGCGCGFRHVLFQDGEWPEECMIASEDYTGEDQQPNHEQLHQLLGELLKSSKAVELYGCWDGDFHEPAAGHEVLPIERIFDHAFYFRERFAYTIKQREQAGASDGNKPPS